MRECLRCWLVAALTLMSALRAVVSKEIVFILAFLAIDVFFGAVQLGVLDTCSHSCVRSGAQFSQCAIGGSSRAETVAYAREGIVWMGSVQTHHTSCVPSPR